MKTKKILFISCKEAKHICDKSQYNESSFWERIQLSIRLVWCSITRAYYKKNKKLTELIENAHSETMDTTTKNNLQSRFNEQLLT